MTRTAPPATGTDSGENQVSLLALDDAYPLTALQAGMLFHSELAAGSATYHDIFTLTLQAEYDLTALHGALAEVSARHPVLRTSFNLTDFSEPLQLVHTNAPPELGEFDLSGLSPERARQELLAWRETEKHRTFDWTVAPLLRVFTHRLPAGLFALTFSFHHAILDGWSVAAMTTEVLRRYAARLAGRQEPVVALPISYRDFVAAEKTAVAAPESAEFWRVLLADAPPAALPRAPGAEPDQGPAGEDVAIRYVEVGADLSEALTAVARRLRVPLRTVLLAAHLRVLGLLTGEPDVTTGVVSHNRPEHEAGAEVLGLFLNAIPVRVAVDRPSWTELVRTVFEAELAILPFRAFPLFEIQRVTERAPLFEALFDYRDFHVYGELPDEQAIHIVGQDFFEQTNVPFAAAFSRANSDTGLLLTLTYQKQRFTEAAIEQAARHYLRALSQLGTDPSTDPRSTDSYLTPAELAQLAEWNDTAGPVQGPATIPESLAAQVAARPDATALFWQHDPLGGEPTAGSTDSRLSYAELGAAVERLARRLTARGVGVGDVVGVLLDRGPELVIAVHAVLAAGAAYLPLDPELPPRRIELMCAGARLAVTTSTLAEALPDSAVLDRLLIDEAESDDALVSRPPLAIPPQSPAYVIYTSGSTGAPKGVAVSHQAITNRLRWMQDAFSLSPLDQVAHKTPFGFDVSVWELCWPLVTGAAMVIVAPGGHRDTSYLSRLFERSGVTIAHFVPSMLEALLEDADAVMRCSGLRAVICSGEALTPALAERFHAALPGTALHNLYGPTEAAIDVTWHHCLPGDDPVPIGGPVLNTEIRILDRLGELLPIGVPGELCIAGVQLATGYLDRPAITAERFTPDRHGVAGRRIYHSGDLARWLPSGEIEYLGRLDQQVKVRGMRIEPGEIEAALVEHPGVRAAAVIARSSAGGGNRLAGYVLPADPDDPVEMDELRRHLLATLAPYMVPATLQTIDAFPLTASGKLDRAALPEPEAAASAGYRPPRDQVEAQLATIWEQLLGLPAIGIDDDFFALGGHSLLALRMTVRIRQEFGRELPVANVLTAPTIRELADEVRQPEHMGAVNPIVPLRRTGDRPVIFLSHALGGQVFRYRPLAARLGDDQPVYTIPARGLIPGQEPHDTLTEMADDYVSYIRSIRPHGPYILGGFCIGGNIAMEVGRRLLAEGEQVPLVFPVWSSADEPVVRSSLEDEAMLMIHALAGGVNVLETIDLEELRAMTTDERLVAVINASAREERLRPDTADLEQARRYLRVFKANAQAVGYFEHDPYPGDVVLLQPVNDPQIRVGDDYGWRRVVSGRFAIAPIPGTRFTSVYEPLVKDMAAQIRKWMDDGFSDSQDHR